jgi:hypothetical protein
MFIVRSISSRIFFSEPSPFAVREQGYSLPLGQSRAWPLVFLWGFHQLPLRKFVQAPPWPYNQEKAQYNGVTSKSKATLSLSHRVSFHSIAPAEEVADDAVPSLLHPADSIFTACHLTSIRHLAYVN